LSVCQLGHHICFTENAWLFPHLLVMVSVKGASKAQHQQTAKPRMMLSLLTRLLMYSAYRNQAKVYGSPMLDVVLARHGVAGAPTGNEVAAAARLQALLAELRGAFA